MSYQTALERLLSLPDFERMQNIPAGQWSYDLDCMYEFLHILGDPHLKLPAIHVTGTKGKGSTAAMMASVLTAAGYRSGLFISPHLHTIRERICINGEPMNGVGFAGLVDTLWPVVETAEREKACQVTLFELLTTMAFIGFIREHCAYQVLEVGLGGRLDATNVVERPLVSIITSISLDHTAILGNTVEAIAGDKAGIIKPGCPVVTAPQAPTALEKIRHVAREQGAPLRVIGMDYTWERLDYDLGGQAFRIHGQRDSFEGWLPLLGRHQIENAACVVAACRALQKQGVALSDNAIQEGLRRVRWPGRLEVLGHAPLVVVDGSHNPYSAVRLREAIDEYLPHQRMVLVFGVSSDKDLDGMARELAPATWMVFACRSRSSRARSTADIKAAFARLGVPTREFPTVAAATDAALNIARGDDLVLGSGSLFTVAEVREKILGVVPEIFDEQ